MRAEQKEHGQQGEDGTRMRAQYTHMRTRAHNGMLLCHEEECNDFICRKTDAHGDITSVNSVSLRNNTVFSYFVDQ